MMIPAKITDSIADFLSTVEESYLLAHPALGGILCEKTFIMDDYEVDPSLAVRDCFSDMMRVKVIAKAIGNDSNNKIEVSKNKKKNLNHKS